MNNVLLYYTGQDIPFPQAKVNIHQPTINEIAMVGEKEYHTGVQMLISIKNVLGDEDKIDLSNNSNFQIFIAVMNTPEAIQFRIYVTMVLSLLFPEYQINITDRITLAKEGEDNVSEINEENFEDFRSILIKIFDIDESTISEYNPSDKRAQMIADKLKKRKNKLQENKQDGDTSEVSIYQKYISILSVGENKSILDLCNYTPIQLKSEFDRYQKKLAYDMHVSAQLAGATGLDDVSHWMDDEEN